jgi:hypothetical protein
MTRRHQYHLTVGLIALRNELIVRQYELHKQLAEVEAQIESAELTSKTETPTQESSQTPPKER